MSEKMGEPVQLYINKLKAKIIHKNAMLYKYEDSFDRLIYNLESEYGLDMANYAEAYRPFFLGHMETEDE